MVQIEEVWGNIYDAGSRTLNLTQRDLRTLPVDIIESFAECAQKIDVSENRLSDLNWISRFVEVKDLILDNNRLCEAHLRRLSEPMTNVTVLMLNKNEFGDLEETMEHIRRVFPNLEHLSLHGNAICPDGLGLRPFSDYVGYDSAYYRSYIRTVLPNLKFLDHTSTSVIDFDDTMTCRQKKCNFGKHALVWDKLTEYLKGLYRKMLSIYSGKSKGKENFENFIINNENL